MYFPQSGLPKTPGFSAVILVQNQVVLPIIKPLFSSLIYKYLSVNARFISLLNPFVSVIAIICCFLPFLLMLWRKLNYKTTYLLVCIYWLINGIANLPECLGQSDNSTLQNQITLIYNLIDTPLVLLVFYFSATHNKKRILSWLIILFMVFELCMVAWKGHNFDSSTIIIGSGGLIILIFSIAGLAEYFNKIEHSSFEITMGFIYAAFIFEYGLSIIIFVFSYLNYKRETVNVNLFVYYLSVISATVLTSYGLWRFARPNFVEE